MKRHRAKGDDYCHSRNRSRKRGEGDDGAEEDRISALPCDIPVLILSCLSLKEAERKRVVSGRWKDLWRSFTGVLDFDGKGAMTMFHLKSRNEQFVIARTKYMKWVYKVLNSLRCPTVEGFRISFHVECVQTLGEWIRFTIQKQVKTLELDLTSEFLHPEDVTNFMLSPCLVNAFTSLRALSLKWVDMTTKAMDSLPSSCVHLEELSLEHSARIEALKFSSPSLKLKYLKIWACFSLKVVEISAMYLLSFACYGESTCISFINVPSFKEVSLGGEFLIDDLPSHRLLLSQLQTLRLSLPCFFCKEGVFRAIPDLGNAIHLDLYTITVWVAAYACDTFFKACTGLQRFTFKTSLDETAYYWKFDNYHPLRSLQVVELLGFRGLPAEVELLLYLLQSSEQLVKIIIHPCFGITGFLKEMRGRKTERYKKARDCALELKAVLPVWEFGVL